MAARNRLLVAGVVGVLMVPHTSVSAQGAHPELAGHTFVPSSLLPDPFIETYLSSVIGLGSAFDYGIAWPVLGEDTLFLADGKIVWVTLDFDYRQRVTDRLAVRGQVQAGARVGTNAASAIADGVSVAAGFRFGGVARLMEGRSAALSAYADVAHSDLTLLNIIGFAEELIDSVVSGGSLDSLSISFNYDAWRWHGGIRLAYSPTPLLGLGAVADVAVGEEFLSLEDSFLDFDLGGSVDFNFHSAGYAPLGVVLSYRFSTYGERFGGSIRETHGAMLGISYMGHEDFSVGLEIYGGRIPLQADDVVAVATAGVQMHYYF